jgi:hypothetical protein
LEPFKPDEASHWSAPRRSGRAIHLAVDIAAMLRKFVGRCLRGGSCVFWLAATMYLLREIVHKATINKGYAEVFTSLLSKLAESNIGIDKQDVNHGEIVARCLTLSANLVLWRCWNDRLLFNMKELDAANTEVTIYSIPNLFRLNLKPDEKTTDLTKLVSELFD